MTVAQKPANVNFKKELVNRFFNPRSYFFLCVSEHLRERRPLDEPGAEEEYALVAALMDRLVNAEDTQEELKKLASAEPFAEYLRILEESVDRFRSQALPPDKLKVAIENVAVLFLDAALACLEDGPCRAQILDFLGIEPEELQAASSSPDVAFVGEKALEPEPVEARFEEEAFLAAYFRGNVSEEFDKVDESGDDDLARARAYLTAFYNVRDLAMIHGEEDVESLAGKMAELLRRELSRGQVRPEVLGLADRVRLFIQNNLPRWDEIDTEQIRVLIGILQDALLGHMPEIVMAVDLEEPQEVPTEQVEEERQKTAGQEPSAEPAQPEQPEAAQAGPGDQSASREVEQPVYQGPDESLAEFTEAAEPRAEAAPQPEESTGFAPEEPSAATEPTLPQEADLGSIVTEWAEQTAGLEDEGNFPEPEAELEPPAEESAPMEPQDEKATPEWGFAEMIGIEEFLDLDEESGSTGASAEPPSPDEEREAIMQAEAFVENFGLLEDSSQEKSQESTSVEEDFHLPGEDDEELLALIREVRSHSEKAAGAESKELHTEAEAARSAPSEAESAEIPPTTRLGYGARAQEAALYLRVLRSALGALSTDPDKRSALEDLDLAASSLKGILRNLGDTKLWAVPAALSAAATVLMEKGGSATRDFLEAAQAALRLLESGPAPALNGRINEVVEELSKLHENLSAGSHSGAARPQPAPEQEGPAERPPFRLRGRRSVEEHRQATGI